MFGLTLGGIQSKKENFLLAVVGSPLIGGTKLAALFFYFLAWCMLAGSHLMGWGPVAYLFVTNFFSFFVTGGTLYIYIKRGASCCINTPVSASECW
jgi:hypothetical protein